MKLKELILKLKHAASQKNPESYNKKYKGNTGWNIYGYKDYDDAYVSFNFTHYRFKYKFLVPILWILKLILGKKLDKPIPDMEQYDNVRVFDKEFETTIKFWVEHFLTSPEDPAHDKKVQVLMDGEHIELLRIMKKIMIFIITQDTAYLEFMNILMHNIAHGMYGMYHGQNVHHLFYSSKDIYNIEYMRIFKQLRDKDKERVNNESGSSKTKQE